jgi:hypothetical protein
MALDKVDSVDAVGIETSTDCVVLTIADSWDWSDERGHLLALQAKLNSYFDFIEEGQLVESYPSAAGRKQVIDVITRYPLPAVGIALLDRARESFSDLQIAIRSRCIPGETPDSPPQTPRG